MKKFLILSLVFLNFSCISKREVSPTAQIPTLNFNLGKAPIEITTPSVKFAPNISYGDHANNVLDIFLPDSDIPTPLVIFIHGGGFTHGSKDRVYDKHADVINKMLENDIAFATIGYRFLQHSSDGVRSSLQDSKRALQFLRYYSSSFNIDKSKVASFGQSAGAGTSLWLGLSDEMSNTNQDNEYSNESTRLVAVGALETQGTYDILRWEEVFASYDIDLSRIPKPMMNELAKFYGVDDAQLLYEEDYTSYRASVDFLSLLSHDDPPIYVENNGKDGPPFFTDIQHHPLHAKTLKQYADEVGVHNVVNIQALGIEDKSGMDINQFLLKYLK